MSSGRIESITPDWRGDTLAEDVGVGDTVLSVTDTADFDEEPDDTIGRWLVLGDDAAPMEYVDVDHEDSTVTLAAPLAAAYEAGLPVNVWDPTVASGGAPAVEYVASVETDRGPVPAVIPHEKVPLSGVDNLIGASVTLSEDEDGDWYVDQVLGREPVLDATGVIRTGESGARVELVDEATAYYSGAAVELYTGHETEPGVEAPPGYLRATHQLNETDALTLQAPGGSEGSGPSLALHRSPTAGFTFAELYAEGDIKLVATGVDPKIELTALQTEVYSALTVGGTPILEDLADGAPGNVDAGTRYVRCNVNGRLTSSTVAPSSRKVKHDIKPLRIDVEKLLQLRPVTYRYNEDPEPVRVGVVAEDAHDLGLTQLVGYEDPEDPDQPTGFDYDGLTVALLPVLAELAQRIESLQTENRELRRDVAALKRQVRPR